MERQERTRDERRKKRGREEGRKGDKEGRKNKIGGYKAAYFIKPTN